MNEYTDDPEGPESNYTLSFASSDALDQRFESSQDFESGLNPLDSWIMAQSNLSNQRQGAGKPIHLNKSQGMKQSNNKLTTPKTKPVTTENTKLFDLNKQFNNVKENKNQNNSDNWFKGASKSRVEGSGNWEEGVSENSRKSNAATTSPRAFERKQHK
jgi:hypothetical protein